MASSTTDTTCPTVLVLLGNYLPGFKAGGPIRSIANLVAAIGGDFRFRIVTQDRDLGEKLPFPGIDTNRWVRVGQADVMYLRHGLPGFLDMYAMVRSVDRETVLYLNGFFARTFSMLPVLMRWLRLSRPKCLVIAPRGEFSPGALQFKHLRKGLYIRLSHWLGLYKGLIWHASTQLEALAIRRQFPLSKSVTVASVIAGCDAGTPKNGTSHVAIASDLAGATTPAVQKRRAKVPGSLRLAFVSRLSPKKNLTGALQILEGLSGNIAFNIYGPAEDPDYWHVCQGLITALPPNIKVQYCGQTEHANVNQVFTDHDLFLFPTLGENYGHVICEALASGCPVLISDQTPWLDLEALGVGWDLPLSEPKLFRAVIQRCVDMGPEEHAVMCARAAAFGASRANNPDVIEENRALFRLALGILNQQ